MSYAPEYYGGEVSPFNAQDLILTLVKDSDYKTGAISGPLLITITSGSVVAGDVVRFGASLFSLQTISVIGVVVEVSGGLFGQFELTKESHTNRKSSECWRWELEHIDGSGNVTPLIVDQEMILKPSHSG